MSRSGKLLLGWTLALLATAAFARLGFWQNGRAEQKARMLEDVAAVLRERRAVTLDAAADPARIARYEWAAGRGHFVATPPLLLDNQQRDGRVGVRAYRVFQPAQGRPLLVDLGWRPIAADRHLPDVALPRGELDVRGLLVAPPSAGLKLGVPMARQGDAWLVVRLDPAVVARALALPALAPRVLRLDPTLPIGYPRDLELLANTLTPERHRGYAVQWFGLAATTLVIALVLTFRRSRR